MCTLIIKEFNLKYFQFFASWKMGCAAYSVAQCIRVLNIHAAVLFIKICSKLNILENQVLHVLMKKITEKTVFKINICCSSNTGSACKPPAETTSEPDCYTSVAGTR
jgi:hypothetical protein